MEQAKQRIFLNIRQNAMQQHVSVKQGDTAFTLQAVLSNGERAAYPISQNSVVSLQGKTPAGHPFVVPCQKIGDSEVSCEISSNLTAVPGDMECELVINDANNRQITAQKFVIEVKETAGNGIDLTQVPEFPIFDLLLSQASQAQQQADTLAQQYETLLQKDPTQGPQGEKGEKGDKGDQGDIGPQGPAGPQGPQGIQGEAGKNGVGIVEVNQSVTSTEDDGINVITVFTSDDKAYNFEIKNGSKGSQGEKGEKGDKGEQGEQGPKGEQGPQGLLGPQGVAGYTPQKGVDYFTPADKAEMVADVTASLEGIPDYWQAHLDQKIVEIRKAMEQAGRNKSAFLWYTDSHWNANHKKSPALLKHLYYNTPINKVNFGGDIVQDEPTDSTIDDTIEMGYVYDWRKAIRGLPNHHSVVGNHDDGSVVDNRFGDEWIYSFLLAPEESNDVVMGEGFYYYIDNNAEKTRYLYLDTAYKMADEEQVEFVTNALKTTPSGWHIVAISHIWHNAQWTAEKGDYIDGYTDAANTFLQLFYDYNHRNGTFADCEGMVEFCIGGHCHWDHSSYFADELLVITTETDSTRERVNITAVEGTITENAVNAVIADYGEKKVSVIRVGRGENQILELKNPYVATYTNVIPLSTDKEGNIFNSIGYKPNTRYSNSGGGFVDATGVYCTGFIEVTPYVKSMIRLKNVRMNINDTASNVCHCLSFTDGFTYDSTSNGQNMVTYMDAKTDADGNIIEFAVNQYDVDNDIRYIVLNTGYIGADSVITINQPIE